MYQFQHKKRATTSPKTSFFGRTAVYPKLTINTPNDTHEQQADAVADGVMRMEEEEDMMQAMPLDGTIQRKCAAGEDEEDNLQAKPLLRKAESEGGLAHELAHVVQQRGYSKGVIHRQAASAPAFSITQIPGIMTAMSWNTAAALMNDWFSRPSHSDPLTGTPNTSAVSVSWANGFSRSRSVYDALVADRIWVNSASQDLIKRRLISVGLPGPGTSSTFGSVSASPAVLDTDYVNYRAVSQGLLAPLDGLAGALANFVFRVAVQGTITDTGASPWYAIGTQRAYRVDIQQVAIYIRDSYDFIGDQSLGCWDPVANTVSRTGIGQANATCVGNVDFRNWRTTNGRGGDFLIYSSPDVLSTSDQFTFYE